MADLTPVTKIAPLDPFELPSAITARQMTYQWCNKAPDPQYQELLDAGWVAVPPQWFKGYFQSQKNTIEIGNSILMCHAYPRDEELDRIEGASRNIQDWMDRFGGNFSGSVTIQQQSAGKANAPHQTPALTQAKESK